MHAFRRSYIWEAGSLKITLGPRTLIMGIVNVTPDSFSHDGVLSKTCREKVKGLSQAIKLLDQGADILDIGGESSRSGAIKVPVKEEASRVVPLIKALVKRTNVPLSVDTVKPLIAKMALDAGASIVNLIQGTPPKDEMLAVVKKFNAGLILMHMRGTPIDMQTKTCYKDVVADVKEELRRGLSHCSSFGVHKKHLVVDPGIGFSKTPKQNLLLLKHLQEFDSLRIPIVIGTSRKSFLGHILNEEVRARLPGTIASVLVAALNGAHIVRVHDVKDVKQALQVTEAIINVV